jgi:hypothetical protein
MQTNRCSRYTIGVGYRDKRWLLGSINQLAQLRVALGDDGEADNV